VTSLTTQKELREARDPGFCYLCGQTWEEKDRERGKRDRDHVPPQAIFGEEHRTPPLVLRTHPKCNNGQSEYDQQIAQLLSLVRKENPTPKDVSTLRVSMHQIEGMAPSGAVEYLPLGMIIARWLRGFHAALYGEYLPQVEGRIHEPFPGGDEPGQDTTLLPIRPVLTAAIRSNRTARNLDTIVAFGNQCRYECVWTPQASGRPICIFALEIPAWRLLADPNFPARSCVGWYRAASDIPLVASRATQLVFPLETRDPLNAFEE